MQWQSEKKTLLEFSCIEAKRVAAIVMNANPFTKGHLFLIENACAENDVMHLFILSEDISEFSTEFRMELAKKATAHLKNLYIHPTSSYMVSAATFPSYFLKEDDNTTEIQARLDAKIFKNHIASALGISIRYVGSEPYSIPTGIYNNALLKEFGSYIQLKIFERIAIEGEIVSASKVRRFLSEGGIEEAGKFVPQPTYDFFFTPEGEKNNRVDET